MGHCEGVSSNSQGMSFEADESLTPWNVPVKEWLVKNDKHWDGLAVGALIFNQEGRILILQRASHDSMPNRWEVPGGAADAEDPSLLHAAARELWEEAGLVARRFTHLVTQGPGRGDGTVFTNRNGTRVVCRFAFNVEVESCEDVKLDPNEHQDFAWASEDEVRKGEISGRTIPVTFSAMKELILEGFRIRNSSPGNGDLSVASA